ncbi:hypothetical protein QTP70_019392, partial [Hemibagrus guttatus]
DIKMPRSFLVKKHLSHKKPNYGTLDSQSGGLASKANIQEHFECFDCHKTYFTFSGLAKHRQLQCEKPFSCPHCSRAFADRSNLRAHLQTHSDVKKYQCRRCSKTFSRISLLSKHEEAGCCPTS